jgi:hypothetical protein
MMKLRRSFWWYWYLARRNAREWVARHAPKIPTRRPEPLSEPCRACGKPQDRLYAVYTGDGWDLFWECENECGDGDSIYNWWPFHFGAHCSANDLRRVGIEVV